MDGPDGVSLRLTSCVCQQPMAAQPDQFVFVYMSEALYRHSQSDFVESLDRIWLSLLNELRRSEVRQEVSHRHVELDLVLLQQLTTGHSSNQLGAAGNPKDAVLLDLGLLRADNGGPPRFQELYVPVGVNYADTDTRCVCVS